MTKVLAVSILVSVFLISCNMITPEKEYSGEITFNDDWSLSQVTGYIYYYDTYILRGSEGDVYSVELSSDMGTRMNLEHVESPGYVQDICSTSGNGYDLGSVTLHAGRNIFNVYLIETDVTADGVAYSFSFTAQ